MSDIAIMLSNAIETVKLQGLPVTFENVRECVSQEVSDDTIFSYIHSTVDPSDQEHPF